MKNFVICTTQRSGKTWLCSTLQKLGNFGWPHEYIDAWHKGIPSTLAYLDLFYNQGVRGIIEYIKEETYMESRSKSPLGLALQWNQLKFLERMQVVDANEILSQLNNSYDFKFFLLMRRDILQQAISQYIHKESGFAHSFQDKESREKRLAVKFSEEEIKLIYLRIFNSYRGWIELFQGNSIDFTTIYYEDMCKNIKPVVHLIAEKIGRDIVDLNRKNIRKSSRSLKKIANKVDKNFRKKFEKLITKGQMVLPAHL
ncbi:Stf0 family sulfotransferase [Thermodesulfobacteriota bacterium]